MKLLNAKNKVLGRLAVEAANLLRGKNKPDYQPHLQQGDKVIIINTDEVRLTGGKLKKKKYYHHSGYPGGIKEIRMDKALEKDSREVVRKAIYGMLPKNKLRNKTIKKLELYQGEKNSAVNQ